MTANPQMEQRMTKRADHNTQLKESAKDDQRPAPVTQTGKNPSDAREDDNKLAKSQRDLGVDKEHKTPDMEKGGRGTFP